MFYLLGFGVGGSSPHVHGHPTSMCNLGVKLLLTLADIKRMIFTMLGLPPWQVELVKYHNTCTGELSSLLESLPTQLVQQIFLVTGGSDDYMP